MGRAAASTGAPAVRVAGWPTTRSRTSTSRRARPRRPTSSSRTSRWATGEEAAAGHTVEVHYVGVSWRTRQQFDASWDRGDTFSFRLGGGQVITGWDEGVVGMKVGGRRRLVIPPGKAYGKQGAGASSDPTRPWSSSSTCSGSPRARRLLGRTAPQLADEVEHRAELLRPDGRRIVRAWASAEHVSTGELSAAAAARRLAEVEDGVGGVGHAPRLRRGGHGNGPSGP